MTTMPLVTAKVRFIQHGDTRGPVITGRPSYSQPYNFKIRPELAAILQKGQQVVVATRYGYSIGEFLGLETITDPAKIQIITKSVLNRIETEHDI